ncbi:MAG: outer membrane lipoprotein carrier protein LolA [Ignavibacteriales bacterium]|nr:MAG: outer membrane lipoprotein carrier protein LolA [Ignavibacteriales bacterium]
MKYLNIIGLLVIFLSINIIAGDEEELLRNVKEKFNSIDDFSANVIQEGKNSFLNGKIYYKKENKFYLDLKNMTIVSDGITIWNHNKKENKVVVNDLGSEENSIFSFNTLLGEYPSKSNISSSKEGNFNVLILSPKEGSGLNFSEARLWINSEYLIEKVSVINENNNITFNFSGYKINQDLPDSRFTFTAPKGSSIIDLR